MRLDLQPTPKILRYLCETTIHPALLDRVSEGVEGGRRFDSLADLLLRLDARLCRKLWKEVLPSLSILDPACGSGDFLVAALDVLLDLYSAVVERIELVGDGELRQEVEKARAEYPSLRDWMQQRILAANLYGVDVLPEAAETTRSRLLRLVGSDTNLDVNIRSGNSLLGLLHVKDDDFDRRQGGGQPRLFRRTFRQAERGDAIETLNEILLDEMKDLDISFEQATWDRQKNELGKPARRPLSRGDVADLRPFHWGYEFHAILDHAGGFDVILTDPPWDAFKPQPKEFFADGEAAKLLRNREVREAWLAYLSRFPHASAYFRSSPQYSRQSTTSEGRKAGPDVFLYKLFLERCFRLLRPGGHCGLLLPTVIYTDPGAKRLREMLFTEASVDVLFGLSNERGLFAGVDPSFRLGLLAFRKGGSTGSFTAAFRIHPREAIAPEQLAEFLASPSEHLSLDAELIRALSPGSFAIPEGKSAVDFSLIAKLYRAPLLGGEAERSWKLRLGREFDTANDLYRFKTSPGPGRLPLYEGNRIQPFSVGSGDPRYWVDEAEARQALLGRKEDTGQALDYEGYRLGFRDLARKTDERTMVMAMLPRRVFCNQTLPTAEVRTALGSPALRSALFLCAVLNSFVAEYLLRQRGTPQLTFSMLLQLPVPRPPEGSAAFRSIVERSAQLTCATADFADLWQDTMASPWSEDVAASRSQDRERLRAELDGLVAHLYGLTEEEFAQFAHILTEEGREAVLAAYRALAPRPTEPVELGESADLALQTTLPWDLP